jgi:hypothetical protein
VKVELIGYFHAQTKAFLMHKMCWMSALAVGLIFCRRILQRPGDGGTGILRIRTRSGHQYESKCGVRLEAANVRAHYL